MGRVAHSDRPFARSTSTSLSNAARAKLRAEARLRAAVTRHVRAVRRALRRAGLTASDAEDASQDAFFVLAQRVDRVPARAERSFLLSTALRIAADRRRSRWNRSVTSGLPLQERADAAPGADDQLDLRRAADLLHQALASLDEDQRVVYVLTELEQLSRSEVASALSIPSGTVATRLRRARAACRAAVNRLARLPGR